MLDATDTRHDTTSPLTLTVSSDTPNFTITLCAPENPGNEDEWFFWTDSSDSEKKYHKFRINFPSDGSISKTRLTFVFDDPSSWSFPTANVASLCSNSDQFAFCFSLPENSPVSFSEKHKDNAASRGLEVTLVSSQSLDKPIATDHFQFIGNFTSGGTTTPYISDPKIKVFE